MSYKKTVLVVAAAACLIFAVGVVGLLKDSAPKTGLVHGNSYPRWPTETLVDWVGFADQVSVADVISEQQMPVLEDIDASGSGYVGRVVQMRLTSTIWRRADAPVAEDPVSVLVDGWWMRDGQLNPYADFGTKRIEVGDRLLVPLVRTPEGRWTLLSSEAVFPLNSGVVVPTEAQLQHDAGPPQALHGMSIGRVARLLASTKPSDAAAKLSKADPDARAKAVWDEQLRTGQSGKP